MFTFLLFVLVLILGISTAICIHFLLQERSKSLSIGTELETRQLESAAQIGTLTEQITKCKQAYTTLRSKAETELKRLQGETKSLSTTIEEQKVKMQRWQVIVDAEAEADRVRALAANEASILTAKADQLLKDATAKSVEILREAELASQSSRDIGEKALNAAHLESESLREEQKAKREYERALRDAKREEEAVQKAMARLQEQLLQASAEERAKYETELQSLQEKLKLAEEKGQRAISMAQQTRCGYVYIISNLGSFGEDVFKIGLTRRLEPMDRVKELGDSSVPFEFDVHALIRSDDAPALEHKLHRHFLLHQVNKVNHRKEFFRCDLATIRKEVEELGLQAQWTMKAEARDYRETLAIEKKIASDPFAREQWLQRQLELELTEDEDELLGVTNST